MEDLEKSTEFVETNERRAKAKEQAIGPIGLIRHIGPIIICSPFLGRVPACGCGSLFGLLPEEGATQAQYIE